MKMNRLYFHSCLAIGFFIYVIFIYFLAIFLFVFLPIIFYTSNFSPHIFLLFFFTFFICFVCFALIPLLDLYPNQTHSCIRVRVGNTRTRTKCLMMHGTLIHNGKHKLEKRIIHVLGDTNKS